MSRSKVAIIDLIRRKEEHYTFNFITINSLINLYDRAECWLSADVSYLDDIKDKAKINKLSIRNSKFYYWVVSSLRLSSLLFKLNKTPVFLLSLTPLQYLITSFISCFKSNDIYAFMHGELGYLKNPVGLGQKAGASFIKCSLRFGKVNFICINSPVHSAMSKLFPDRKFSFVEHPTAQTEPVKTGEFPSGSINFGSFGVHSAEKGSDKIYGLTKLLDMDSNDTIRLMTVGVTDGSFQYDQSEHVTHYCRGMLREALISKEDFFSSVSKIDVALIFNNSTRTDEEKYDLVSSGVFSDCIAFLIPVVAMKNKQLETYFTKYGEFGVLCNSIDEMRDAVKKISADRNILNKYRSTMMNIKKQFSASEHQKKIHEIIK